LLELIAWNSFEFAEVSYVSGYSILDPCAFYTRSYYAPFCYDMCSSSDHIITSCPFYACYPEADLSLPLVQYTRFEVSEAFGLVAKFDMDVACCESEDMFDVVRNLLEPPFKVSCDVYVHKNSSSLGSNYVIYNPLD